MKRMLIAGALALAAGHALAADLPPPITPPPRAPAAYVPACRSTIGAASMSV